MSPLRKFFWQKRRWLKRALRTYYVTRTPFYKQYAYSSLLPVLEIDQLGMIDFELGIFYNRIPKAANSSVIVNLAEIKTGGSVTSDTEARKKIPTTPSHMSLKQVRALEYLYKFTFVRDPYTRVLSAYLDKVVRSAFLLNPLKTHISRSMLKRIGGIPSFKDFLFYLDREGLYHNVHWAPQTSLLLMPVEKFNYIGKVENFGSDLELILKHVRSVNSHKQMSVYRSHATYAEKSIGAHYDNSTRRLVEKLYRDDFDVFRYPIFSR